MAKYIALNIYMDTIAVTHLLGGLSKSYRDLTNYPDIRIQIKSAIESVLNDLHRQKVNLSTPAFKTYVQLINWQPINKQ